MPIPAAIDALEPRRLFASVGFAIDSDASFLTIDAKVDVDHAGDFHLRTQADGLDTAQLKGTLLADVTTKGVKFAGGSAIEAVEHDGAFDPGNTPAAFAVDGKVKKLGITLAEVDAAFRDLQFDLTSTSRGKADRPSKTLQVRNAMLAITGGTVDYELDSKFGDSDGSKSLDGLSAKFAKASGKLTGLAGSRAITVPILLSYSRDVGDAKVTFTLKGRIVGRETEAATTSAVAAASATSSIRTTTRALDDVFGASVAIV